MRDLIKAVQEDLRVGLQAIGDKHGVVLTLGNARYSDTNATMKLELSKKDASGMAITREAAAFLRDAAIYGLEPSDLGRTFTSNGRTFKITGSNPRSQKYPILAALPNEKQYKFHDTVVKRGLI